MPETRYARSGDVMIAYQVLGEGPFDVVVAPGNVSQVEVQWEVAGWAAFLRGVAEQARVLVFDKRGTGMSDRVAGVPTLEERSDDIRAVMDAAGSERPALIGFGESVPMSVVFAASYPSGCRRLCSMAVRLGCCGRLTIGSGTPSESTGRNWRRTLKRS